MAYENMALLAGRVLFGFYFVVSGLNHFMKDEQLSGWIESKGYPVPELLNYFGGGQLIFGGILTALALRPVIGLGSLALFLVAVTPAFHDFWNMEGEDRMNNMVNFMKNIALFSAVLIMFGAGDTVFAEQLVSLS